MVAQPTLFDAPAGRVRRTDPVTSLDAARAQGSGTRTAILEAFRLHGPLTDDELCARLPGHYGPTVRTARSGLYRDGFVVATDRKRRSSRGRDQLVWAMAS